MSVLVSDRASGLVGLREEMIDDILIEADVILTSPRARFGFVIRPRCLC